MTTRKKKAAKVSEELEAKAAITEETVDLSDGHHMGKHAGYRVRDGKIYPAPCDVTAINQIREKRAGLDAYVRTLNKFIAEQYQEVEASDRRWWKNLVEDLGLGTIKSWVYNYVGEYVCEQKVKE